MAIDYGFTIELCTPRQPQQKGAVEHLVGFVKRAFFRARRFTDLTTDLPPPLTAWLVEVNTVRPSRATKEIPAVRLVAEQQRMKPLAVAPSEYGLRVAVTVGPTAMVTQQHLRYAMPAAACGLPATLWLYPDRVKIVTAGSRHEAVHPRFPAHGTVSDLPGQRAAQLAAVAGARQKLYFMRERILELGPWAKRSSRSSFISSRTPGRTMWSGSSRCSKNSAMACSPLSLRQNLEKHSDRL